MSYNYSNDICLDKEESTRQLKRDIKLNDHEMIDQHKEVAVESDQTWNEFRDILRRNRKRLNEASDKAKLSTLYEAAKIDIENFAEEFPEFENSKYMKGLEHDKLVAEIMKLQD